MDNYDVVIVGGGPGGYVAAIRAATSGLSVALVEGRELGGTCLNRGCIPSKTLLKHADVLNQIKNSQIYGITINDYSFSLEDMVYRKDKVIHQLRSGVQGLLRKNRITYYQGYGNVREDKIITISTAKGEEMIKGENVILATGSQPFIPNIPGLKDVKYDTSDTVFDLKEVPSRLVIIGGGVIGLEIACVFNSFGTEVEIVEMAESIIPSEDTDAAKFLTVQLEKRGITIHTESRITRCNPGDHTTVEIDKKGKKLLLETDALLVSVGREPNLNGINELPINYNGRFVEVDQNMKTSIEGIYAIGDLIGGYQLAHAASKEGIRAVHHILGIDNKKEEAMPRCVYTFPEVASVGMTESTARKSGYQVKTQKIDLAANGKAIAAGENSGFMKIIADEKYGEILGVVMVGPHVTEMISQVTSYIHLEGTVEEMETMIFPHPTLAEGLFETAAAWLEKGIHYS